MSESKHTQIVEPSIVLLDRVLSNSSGQGDFDNQRLGSGTDRVGSGLNAHVERLLVMTFAYAFRSATLPKEVREPLLQKQSRAYPFASAWMNLSGFVSNATL
jgi:hypothetical protein